MFGKYVQNDKPRVLYMRNTFIPLQVGWFDADGVFFKVSNIYIFF